MCRIPWGSKKWDTTGRLNNNPAVHESSKTAVLDLGFRTARYSVRSNNRVFRATGAVPVTLKVFSVFPEKIICLHHQLGGAQQCPQTTRCVPYLPVPSPHFNRLVKPSG